MTPSLKKKSPTWKDRLKPPKWWMTSAARMTSKIATRIQNSHHRRAGTLLLMLMGRQLPDNGQSMPAICVITRSGDSACARG